MNQVRLMACLSWLAVLFVSPAIAATGAGNAPAPSTNEPTVGAIRTEPSTGHCRYDLRYPGANHATTGYEAGVSRATTLVALYVPCADLERAKSAAGSSAWLPEWVSYETNTVALDASQIAAPTATVATLCRDARTGHPAPMAKDFRSMVEAGHAAVGRDRPVVYFGVIGEEAGVCYLATLRSAKSPAGEEARLLTVTAFMLAGRQWVYQNVRRRSQSGEMADETFAEARSAARDFLASNPNR